MELKSISQKPTSEKKRKSTALTRKYTHLHLQEKGLDSIKKIQSNQLEVLYLFSNKIGCLDNLDGLPNLTSLYLQRNRIDKIENLQNLKNLRRLFLGHNNITVLEGLEELRQLEELHIEKQSLKPGDTFCFDPRTIYYLSDSLRVLNISGNKITSIKYLSPLVNLIQIDANDNDLCSTEEVCNVVKNWFRLRSANFSGNPFAKQHRYRDQLIATCYRLECLDNKNISETNRIFIKRFQEERLMAKSKPSINITDLIPGVPKTYSHSVNKAVSSSLLQRKNNDILFDDSPTEFIAWNHLPSKVKPKPRIAKLTIPCKNKTNTSRIINKFP